MIQQVTSHQFSLPLVISFFESTTRKRQYRRTTVDVTPTRSATNKPDLWLKTVTAICQNKLASLCFVLKIRHHTQTLQKLHFKASERGRLACQIGQVRQQGVVGIKQLRQGFVSSGEYQHQLVGVQGTP